MSPGRKRGRGVQRWQLRPVPALAAWLPPRTLAPAAAATAGASPCVPPPAPHRAQALRKPWRQNLTGQMLFGHPMSPGSLAHLASAQQAAAEDDHLLRW